MQDSFSWAKCELVAMLDIVWSKVIGKRILGSKEEMSKERAANRMTIHSWHDWVPKGLSAMRYDPWLSVKSYSVDVIVFWTYLYRRQRLATYYADYGGNSGVEQREHQRKSFPHKHGYEWKTTGWVDIKNPKIRGYYV
jgi:hypothetical protein